MPRPGSRPYECVRRAWHSERHHPIRGSIIQQIFRVVNESHTSATKKNEEWQVKLPIVVLKAEEIMYSKANSEAEYMDLETIWDRVNDAINTIIRRDETTETGELLPPCVEAALNLGCVPVRASRSQRHNDPRSYLSPRTQESGCLPPNISGNMTNEQSPMLLPLHSAKSAIERPMAVNLTHSISEPNRHGMQLNKNNPTISCNFPLPFDKFPSPGNNQFISVERNTSTNVSCVYPLYYGTHFQPKVSQLGIQSQNPTTVIVGTPVFPSIAEPAEVGRLQNLYSCDGDESTSNRISQGDFIDNREKAPELTECDLSLRLGLFSDPCLCRGNGSARKTNDVGPSSSLKGGKFIDPSPHQNNEFSFFPVNTAYDPFEFCTIKSNYVGEGQNIEEPVRKRKVPFNNCEDGQFFW